MIDIESKIISCREDTNDYRLCLTREEIEEIKNAWNDGYYQGATDMEEAKQIIIDSLLKLVESTRAETIDEVDRIIQFVKDNSFNHRLEYDSFKAIGSSVIIDLLEQLKEQK